MNKPTCIHRCGCGGLCDSGHPCPMADNAPPLCPACQADYDEDPAAWQEFGDHPEGVARWQAEQEQIDQDTDAPAPILVTDPSIPL